MKLRHWLTNRWFLISVILIVILYELGTGSGLWLTSRVRLWEQQSSHLLAPNLESNILVSPKLRRIFIPFVVYAFAEGPPYGLALSVWDSGDNQTYDSITVTKVTLKYANGESYDLQCSSTISLLPTPSDSGVVAKGTGIVASNLITGHHDVKIIVDGFATPIHGKTVNFSMHGDFVAESQNSLKTTWEALANM